MFSGIVQGVRRVVAKETTTGLLRLTIDLESLATDLRQGASVSVSGVCLTAVSQEGTRVTFDVIQETVDKTTLGSVFVGDGVNIERSLRAGDEIGGHRVSGHVTGTASIRRIDHTNEQHVVTVACRPEWMEYLLPKGFVALDGCSLTIIEVGTDSFTVSLIPETLRVTTFGIKKEGDELNLELDPETQAIVASVKRYLQKISL